MRHPLAPASGRVWAAHCRARPYPGVPRRSTTRPRTSAAGPAMHGFPHESMLRRDTKRRGALCDSSISARRPQAAVHCRHPTSDIRHPTSNIQHRTSNTGHPTVLRTPPRSSPLHRRGPTRAARRGDLLLRRGKRIRLPPTAPRTSPTATAWPSPPSSKGAVRRRTSGPLALSSPKWTGIRFRRPTPERRLQKTDSRRRTPEGRFQKTDARRQTSQDRLQKTDPRRLAPEDRFQKSDARSQTPEVRR